MAIELAPERLEDPPVRSTQDPVERRDEKLASVIPDSPNKPYDMKEVVSRVVVV